MILIYLATAWFAGILIGAAGLPRMGLGLLLLAGLPLLLAGPRRPAGLLGLCLICAALGGLRYNFSQSPPDADDIRLLAASGELRIAGVVATDPRRSDEGQQITLDVEAVEFEGQARPASGRLLANLPPYPAYHYGQRLLLSGALEPPRSAERPGEFDYRQYLARKGIFVLLNEPQARPLPGQGGNPALRALLDFRDHCSTLLLRMLPEPMAALAIGILLGLQAAVPDEINNAFSATGTSHILVVSGWNFTIVAAILAGLAGRLGLGRRTIFWPSLMVMWIYALFVGASAAVLRAATMASLVLLAGATERRSEPWTLLLGACWLMTIQSPQALWDVGFQLSALATGSLFAFGAPVTAWLQRFPPLRWPALAWVVDALSPTLAAQVLTLPIILYTFGKLSIVAPLANIVVVPAVPYAMLLGSIALVGGLIWLPLGQALGWLAWLPLAWISGGTRKLAELPFAAVQVPPLPLAVLIGYYAVILWWQVKR
jgi:competence protein ComEC